MPSSPVQRLLGGALLLLAGTACDGFGSNQPEGTLKETIDVPNYVDHIQPMMETYCDECHSLKATLGAPDYFRTDTYADEQEPGLRSYALSSLNRMVDTPGRPMPTLDRPSMSQQELDTFDNWIQVGAPYAVSDTGLVF